MKRIKTACLEQTVHFQLKEDIDHEMAVKMVNEEYEHYKRLLEKKFHSRMDRSSFILKNSICITIAELILIKY